MMLCDTHVHVVGDPAAYPMIANRTYTPAIAGIETLQQLGERHGIGRFVIVQPSFYGTDNTLLIDALAKLGDRGRGVAVIDPAATAPSALSALHAAGVRGLRINLYSAHGAARDSPADRFTALAAVAVEMGWHVQVIAPLLLLVEMADILGASPAPVVIDHYGLPGGATPDSGEGQRLLGLLRHGHAWVKLSAPYRSIGDDMGVEPDPAWLAALLDTAGPRCLWGSDWPHTPAHLSHQGQGVPLPYRSLDYGRVIAAFRAAMPSAAAADAVMGANPARLYEFPDQ